MRSPEFRPLFVKDLRELFTSKSCWFLILIIGPLVGHGFITAVDLYAEASGIGGAAALPQGLSPLDGILAPAFGAYDLAATLLFPFVAIRLISAEKESGALKLTLQLPGGIAKSLLAKGTALAVACLAAFIPGLIALILWKSYGGHLYWPETANLILGHLLRVMVAAGVAIAAAAIANSASTAAIIALGFTVGTWALDFVAAGRGGLLQQLAAYTPAAALHGFEQGQLRFGTVLVVAGLSLAGFGIAAVWLPTGRSVVTKASGSLLIACAFALVVWCGSAMRAGRDLSENRRNSFSKADEETLAGIKGELRVSVFLAAEDPRLTDLEQSILSKLRRVVPAVSVEYAAQSRSGLFENGDEHYGEVWYELAGRKVMSRSTTEPIILEMLYELAGIPAPPHSDEPEFPGYPLAVRAKGANWIFYLAWPVSVAFCFWMIFHRRRS